eukprot:scaffold2874_cov110-Alexandrium_tamarense.AAC.31
MSICTSASKRSTSSEMEKPNRPCSVYNLFFLLEREVLLHDIDPNRPQRRQAEIESNFKRSVSTDNDERPIKYRHLVLADNWYKTGRKDRKHRKVKGPSIGFADLNKMISQRWKSGVPEDVRTYLKRLLDKEWVVYCKELKLHEDEKNGLVKAKTATDCDEEEGEMEEVSVPAQKQSIGGMDRLKSEDPSDVTDRPDNNFLNVNNHRIIEHRHSMPTALLYQGNGFNLNDVSDRTEIDDASALAALKNFNELMREKHERSNDMMMQIHSNSNNNMMRSMNRYLHGATTAFPPACDFGNTNASSTINPFGFGASSYARPFHHRTISAPNVLGLSSVAHNTEPFLCRPTSYHRECDESTLDEEEQQLGLRGEDPFSQLGLFHPVADTVPSQESLNREVMFLSRSRRSMSQVKEQANSSPKDVAPFQSIQDNDHGKLPHLPLRPERHHSSVSDDEVVEILYCSKEKEEDGFSCINSVCGSNAVGLDLELCMPCV